MNLFRRYRILAGAAMFGLALLSGPLAAGKTYAYFDTCRSDPKVFMNNGYQVVVTATIGDANTSDITSVSYIVHAPVGTSVTHVVYTNIGQGLNEQVLFVADQPSGTYVTDTVVHELLSNVPVTAQTTLVTPYGSQVSASTSGSSEQHLWVQVNG